MSFVLIRIDSMSSNANNFDEIQELQKTMKKYIYIYSCIFSYSTLVSLFTLLQFLRRLLLLPPTKLNNLLHNKAIPLLHNSRNETRLHNDEQTQKERGEVSVFFLFIFRVCRKVRTYHNTDLYAT
jgi:hypothetical protein